ncbi:hypothetical protein [Xanthomonas sp. 60]
MTPPAAAPSFGSAQRESFFTKDACADARASQRNPDSRPYPSTWLARMTHTGPFQIIDYQAAYDAAGQITRITALTLQCQRCETTSSSGERELMHLPGGTVFRCSGCGAHQAVSNARLAHLEAPAVARPNPYSSWTYATA